MHNAVKALLFFSIATGALFGFWKKNVWAFLWMLVAQWMLVFIPLFIEGVISGRLK